MTQPTLASKGGTLLSHFLLAVWVRRLAFLVVALVVWSPAMAAVVEYTYDEIGRLVGVYAPSGDAAQYVYDAAGNITEIKRFTASQLSIIEFTPNSGPVGTTVTIWGTGFSTTPSSNTVTFNGTAATVSAATANKLTVTVPSGATTGAIGVTVGGGSTTTTANFTVTGTTGAPTISSFSPAGGAAGTAVSITGTNFETTISLNDVNLNTTFALVSSASSTSISTTVPANTGSGKFKVRTPNGTAYSSTDFLVPYGTHAAADLVSTTRATVNGSAASFSIGTAGKVAMVLFDGIQGQDIGIALGPFTFTPAGGNVTVNFLRPDGVIMTGQQVLNLNGTSIDLPRLPLTGTYTIGIAASASNTVSGTVAVSTDVTAALTEGTATNATVGAGQNGRFTFSGTAGQKAAVYVSGISSGLQVSNVELRDPFGWVIASASSISATAFIQAQTLTTTGVHSIFVSPLGIGTGSYSVQYGVPDLTVTSFTPGTVVLNQNGTYTIPLTAGVSNQGTVGVRGVWADKGYLSADATLDTADKVVVSQSRGADLSSAGSYSISPSASVPAGTASGTYTMFFKADGTDNGTTYTASSNLTEANEANNVYSASVTLPPLPDLSVSNFSVGTITVNGNGSYNIPITFTVTNVGSGNAKGSWYDACYLSTDGTLGTTDDYLGWQLRLTDLAASAQYNVSYTCVTPTTTTAGGYTLFVKSDGYYGAGSKYSIFNYLAETDEANNVTSTPITLPTK